MQQAAPHTVMADAMLMSFRNWGSKNKKYKSIYKKLDDSGFAIIKSALSEIDEYKPGYYGTWWDCNHMRFYGTHGDQLRHVHELMYYFLTAYCGGTLADDNRPKSKPKQTRSKASKRKREDSNNIVQMS